MEIKLCLQNKTRMKAKYYRVPKYILMVDKTSSSYIWLCFMYYEPIALHLNMHHPRVQRYDLQLDALHIPNCTIKINMFRLLIGVFDTFNLIKE